MELKQILNEILSDESYYEFNRLLKEGLDPNSIVNFNSEERIIHVLAQKKYPGFLSFLFKYHPEPNVLTRQSKTAIAVALENRNSDLFEAVKILLNNGVDPNIVDDLGENALHKAVVVGDFKVVKLLLNYGVDITQKNNTGETPIDKAENNMDLKTMLLTYEVPENEILINRIHFIWLGSSLNPRTAKNIPKWIDENKDCNFDIYIWYDSKLITIEEEEATYTYVKNLKVSGENLLLCDVRKYDIMNIALNDDFVKVIEAYNYESGIWPRSQINILAREIVNWGFVSDVLRMLILYKYQGFYVDVDMEPIRLCEYFANKRIKSCPIRFCMTNAREINAFDYDIDNTVTVRSLNNNALYYDSNFDSNFDRMKKYFRIVANGYKWLQDDYYHYLLFNFVKATVLISGPSAVSRTLGISTNDNTYFPTFDEKSNYVLRMFKEDPLVASISWTVKKEKYDVLGNLLSDLFNDKDELMRCYYKMFGTKFYDLTLIESNWLTEILSSAKYLQVNEKKLDQKVKALVDKNSDLQISLSKFKIDNLIEKVVILKSTYFNSDIYPTPNDIFIRITLLTLLKQFWWGTDSFIGDPIMMTIGERLLPISHKKSESIPPKFFALLLEYTSHIRAIYVDNSLTDVEKETLYPKYYDLIDELVYRYN